MANYVNALRKTGPLPDRPFTIIVSCEHGGNTVPEKYIPLFKRHKKLLKTHRSYDHGAAGFAKALARALGACCYTSEISRLLVDLNRSPGHPKLFSEISGKLDRSAKDAVLDTYYYPHRNAVESSVAESIRTGRAVLHIAVHTFTPVLDGVKRNADAGFLYDPSRAGEKTLCIALQKALKALHPRLTMRRNYPYPGKADGLIPYFRKKFPDKMYVGIELEINQKHTFGDNKMSKDFQLDIIRTFDTCSL